MNEYSEWFLTICYYTTQELFLTTKCIKLVKKEEFAAVTFDLEYETFIIYIALLINSVDVHLSHRP